MKEIKLRWSSHVPVDHISVEFLQGMLDRMIVGFHNYGHSSRCEGDFDAVASLRLRMTAYRKTRNTEFLMDAANFAMMEFIKPKYKGAKYTPTTKRESPGAVLKGGRRVKGKEDM